MKYWLQCEHCHVRYKSIKILYHCDECNGLLEVRHDLKALAKCVSTQLFDERWRATHSPHRSGVWRYHELILPVKLSQIVTRPEGNTNLYAAGRDEKSGLRKIGEYVGVSKFYLKHEGENPTGSFKDRGMTVGITQAVVLGAKAVACASTGNTSASLASYAAQAGLPCFVFLPEGKISTSKLAQAVAHGAITVQLKTDFDGAMKIVQYVCDELDIYLLNSINPFRLEGQKSIALELLQQLNWKVPDWIVLPAGNLGNTSAIGKALLEARQLGLIKRLPRIASIQAQGANPFYRSFQTSFEKRFKVQAETIASAIRIGDPVSFARARQVILETNGVVESVTDKEILEAKAVIDNSGIGCEPASAATVAGTRKLMKKRIIKPSETVAGILTGHLLKDPEVAMMVYTRTTKAIKSTGVNPAKLGRTLKKFLHL
ncbi:threonine synthase [Candidatus Acetothermia bacterium]|nr:threonine synthase [Candidatus Acetothermia bacterium]MBI3660401.1 threonine synthase [Candidatus Acetothermia bacterium]